MFGKATICGWVANPPKEITAKVPMASVSIGYNTGKKNADGSKDSAFLNCTLFNSGAEFALGNFEKGDLVYVEGNLVQNRYTDKQGNQKEYFQLNATYSAILKKKVDSGGNHQQKAPPKKMEDFGEIDDSEIPF